ncbi:major facilitator family transporter [Sporocytophaga myxococcoides]|uniref:Major facilitator family transporter n=1 Tax=Sporocytophaga myxococcoides TaxID=153721 RepID=A0A098LF07_9BACT|nr:MFS transporter [Sporocytophaga myxococcoides]GAL85032.1 major facilitator family transporter [Sporocytophaga myxococcoides]
MSEHSRTTQRIAVGLLFFLHGLCFSSWASRIPDIQQKLKLTEVSLGMVLFALPIGLLASMPLSGWLTARYGSSKIVLGAILSYGLILSFIGLAEDKYELILALFLFGVASNTVNIAVNTQALIVEALYHRSIMASFHGLWSLAGFSGAALGSFMISKGNSPQLHFFIVTLFIFCAAAIVSFFIPKAVRKENKGPLFVLPDKSIFIYGLIAFCCMTCEGAMFDWSGVYFKKVVLAEKGWIGIGYSAFMSTMALGRFFADSYTTRFGLKQTLFVSGLLITVGLLTAIIFPTLYIAIAGFLLVGFGVSSVVPLAYGAAGKSTKVPTEIALTAVASIGFIGLLIGPPLIGLFAGLTSLRISFLIISFLGLSVALLSFVIKQEQD